MADRFVNPVTYNDPFFRSTIDQNLSNQLAVLQPTIDRQDNAFNFLTGFLQNQLARELEDKNLNIQERLGNANIAAELRRSRESMAGRLAETAGKTAVAVSEAEKDRQSEERIARERNEAVNGRAPEDPENIYGTPEDREGGGEGEYGGRQDYVSLNSPANYSSYGTPTGDGGYVNYDVSAMGSSEPVTYRNDDVGSDVSLDDTSYGDSGSSSSSTSSFESGDSGFSFEF